MSAAPTSTGHPTPGQLSGVASGLFGGSRLRSAAINAVVQGSGAAVRRPASVSRREGGVAVSGEEKVEVVVPYEKAFQQIVESAEFLLKQLKAGYEQARADLAHFAETGEAPRANLSRPPGPSRGRGPFRDAPADRQQRQRDLAVQRQPRHARPGDCYQIHYSDVTISLLNMGEQRTLDVRFPLPTEPPGKSLHADNAHWTNHPECVRRTWIEKISNPPVEGTERWFHVEFDLTSLFDD